MAGFQSPILAELLRQLLPVPAVRRREQMQRIERVYWELLDEQLYTHAEVVYRITGFRTDLAEQQRVSVAGRPLRHDLCLLFEKLSQSLEERVSDYQPAPLTTRALAEELGVSTKTIERYRRQGLPALYLKSATGRKKPMFYRPLIDRFLANRGQMVSKAARFQRLSEQETREIFNSARRLASQGLSISQVAEQIAASLGRSLGAIRHQLLLHDAEHAEDPLFPGHRPPLTVRQQRLVERAYHAGIAVRRIAERLGKSPDVIYRTIHLRQAESIERLSIQWVDNPVFHVPDAEQFIFEKAPDSKASVAGAPVQVSNSLPIPEALSAMLDQTPLGHAAASSLFVRYNFLKFHADRLRRQLDPYHPRAALLDRVLTTLRRAERIRSQLMTAHLRLVISLAQRHLLVTGERDRSIANLVHEGWWVLQRAIEQFDVQHGHHFDSALTWQLTRQFARRSSVFQQVPEAGMLEPAMDWLAVHTPGHDRYRQLVDLLDVLEPVDQMIVARHLGLDAEQDREIWTQQEIAESLGLPLNVIRRRERESMHRLEQRARELQANLPLPFRRLSAGAALHRGRHD